MLEFELVEFPKARRRSVWRLDLSRYSLAVCLCSFPFALGCESHTNKVRPASTAAPASLAKGLDPFHRRAEQTVTEDQRKKIDAWWTEFAARENDIDKYFSKSVEMDIPAWMNKHLGAVDDRLMWEFGPAVHKKGHRLVITPEVNRYLRPLVTEMLNRAPKLERWEFYPYRLPEGYDEAEQMVKARSRGSIANVSFVATISKLNKIDLVFYSPNYSSENDRQGFHDVFVAIETMLGEEVLDKWVGGIEVAPLKKDVADLKSVKQLKTEVDEKIAEVRSKLPDVPYFKLSEKSQWTLYKLDPKHADDFPGQGDMFVGSTMIVPMWQNSHRNTSFDSIRFSKCGETFCYIKLDGASKSNLDQFKDRSEIEDAINPALRTADVGCIVGAGTGLRYSYIDLALTDVDRAAEVVKNVLRGGNIGKRGWILFFDTDREAEWIGIWDDSPPPPMRDFTAKSE